MDRGRPSPVPDRRVDVCVAPTRTTERSDRLSTRHQVRSGGVAHGASGGRGDTVGEPTRLRLRIDRGGGNGRGPGDSRDDAAGGRTVPAGRISVDGAGALLRSRGRGAGDLDPMAWAGAPAVTDC